MTYQLACVCKSAFQAVYIIIKNNPNNSQPPLLVMLAHGLQLYYNINWYAHIVEGKWHLLFCMNMRFVDSIELLCMSVIIICKHRNEPAKEIPPKKKYYRNTFQIEVIKNFFVVVEDTL